MTFARDVLCDVVISLANHLHLKKAYKKIPVVRNYLFRQGNCSQSIYPIDSEIDSANRFGRVAIFGVSHQLPINDVRERDEACAERR
jgi:hypothetical protein